MPDTWEDYPQLLEMDIDYLKTFEVERPNDVTKLSLGTVLDDSRLREILTMMGCRVVLKK